MTAIGAWKNYDELEECLTLDELLELYREVISAEARRTSNTAKAFGSDVELDLGLAEDGNTGDDEEGEEAFTSLFDRVSDRLGKDVTQKDKSQEFRQMKMGYQRIN